MAWQVTLKEPIVIDGEPKNYFEAEKLVYDECSRDFGFLEFQHSGLHIKIPLFNMLGCIGTNKVKEPA